MSTAIEREKDVEELRRIALALEASNRHLIGMLEAKCKELESLKGSENELQMTLSLIEQLTAKQNKAQADSVANRDGETTKHKSSRNNKNERSRSGPTPQPNLPVVVEVCTLDEADRTCPKCGGELREMKGQFEESNVIDVEETEYVVKYIRRQKYNCTCGLCIDTALGPERATPGSRYSRDFAIKVATDKYLDHIPLERQVRIMARHGLVVTSQTLWDQLRYVAEQLEPISDALLAHVIGQRVIGLDQTGWPKLGAGRKAKPWQMWCLTAPDVVVHRIRDDKSAATFKQLVGDYVGVIVCDALATHGAGARGSPHITLAGCWAHVHRKFQEALEDHPAAQRMLAWISLLYEIDERAGDDIELRARLRATESVAVLDDMKDWLWQQAELTTLALGKAAAYVVANWQRLIVFATNPRVPLDNNGTERGIRGPVVGRKNHYGSKSRRGTHVASIFYTLFETAKLHGINPAAYIRQALRAADRGIILLPWQEPQ
ncbi:MAG: IS66 family transposase [Hyphomicrobiaceae bacterium]|nr:IS66 family transposase [Hyphomicrobiaceae bacterium]